MSGKHTAYVIKIYERNEGQDYSEEIKLAVNKQLTGKGHVTKVEKNEEEQVQE